MFRIFTVNAFVQKVWFEIAVVHLKNTNGMTNRLDPDQTVIA